MRFLPPLACGCELAVSSERRRLATELPPPPPRPPPSRYPAPTRSAIMLHVSPLHRYRVTYVLSAALPLLAISCFV